jgi:glyoxylase-like metal-dependent hydrolase (beta-lactamase superfamily II)
MQITRWSVLRGAACAALVAALSTTATVAQQPGNQKTKPLEPGTLPETWYAGSNCIGAPDFTVHAYNPDFYIFRQSACSHFEKPFLYLIFGRDQVLLVDTGTGDVNTMTAVDLVIRDWVKKHKRAVAQLVVAHTHNHTDHVGGDAHFVRRLGGSMIIGHRPADVQKFFQIINWPAEGMEYDLGDRVIDIIPVPGHEASSIAFYDRRTGILLTGDTFYPGRLYVRDGAAYTASIKRLVDFTANRQITHILGSHIENTSKPGVDYPEGTVDQPDEHVLQLTRAQLLELNAALEAMQGNITKKVLPDFTIWPVQGR